MTYAVIGCYVMMFSSWKKFNPKYVELLGKLKMPSSVVAQTSETYVDDNQIFFTQLLSNIYL